MLIYVYVYLYIQTNLCMYAYLSTCTYLYVCEPALLSCFVSQSSWGHGTSVHLEVHHGSKYITYFGGQGPVVIAILAIVVVVVIVVVIVVVVVVVVCSL